MLGNSIEYPSKFSFKPMQDVADYARTMNMATQAVAKGSENIGDTGDAHAVVDGEHDASLAQCAALTIADDTCLTKWVTATAYTAAESIQFVEDANGGRQWYRCIADHTSSAATKPGQKDHINSTWRTYWTESSNRAINAVGDLVSTLSSRYYLVLKRKTTGTLTTVIAGDVALDAAVELSIPQFDPQLHVAVAIILLNSDTDPNVWGTTDDNGEVAITQLIGPVFPTNKGITDDIQGNTGASTIV